MRFQLKSLKPGDHLSFIYRTKDEKFSFIIPFILQGLKNNEKCLYIADESTREEIIDAFRKYVDIDSYLNSGQFVVLMSEEAYLKNGYFDPDRMIQLLREAEKEAIKEGYSGLRGTGEMTWFFTELPGVEKLIEYEAKLNEFFPKSKCIAVCQYNENKFDTEMLIDVILTHPKVVIQDSVCENPYYMPPNIFLARIKRELSKEIYEKLKNEILYKRKIEDKLKLYKEIFDRSNDGIAIIDPNGYYLEQNPAHRELLGYSDEELKGKTPAIHMGKEQFSRIYEELSKKGWYRGEVKCYKKDSTPIFVELSAFPIEDENGNVICYVGIKRDVTHRKALEMKLKESEKKYRLIVENVRDVVVTVDANGIRTYVSPSVERVLGYKPEEMVGKSVFEYVHPDDLDFVKAEFFNSIKERRECKATHRYKRKDGKWIWMESIGTPLYENGKFIGGVIITRDITERIELEMKLRESEERYRLLIDSSIDAIITANDKAEIVGWNKGAEKIFGYKADEIIGKPVTLLIPERLRERFKEGFSRFKSEVKSVKSPSGRLMETFGLRKNGEEFPVEMSYYVWRSKDRMFFTTIIRDISKRKEMERKLKESEEKFRKIFENTPNLIAIVNKDGVFIEANPSMIKSLGVNPIGKTFYDVLPKEVAERRMEYVRKALKENKTITFQDTRDGRYFINNMIPIELPEGKHCLIIAKDMTELMRLNRLLNAINNINKLMIHQKDKQKLLEKACKELASLEDYFIVTICLVEDDGIKPLAVAGETRKLYHPRIFFNRF